MINYFINHKFYIETTLIGVGGITLPELIIADHTVKILVGLATLLVIIDRWYRERKKNNN